jgi:hypothetical protein
MWIWLHAVKMSLRAKSVKDVNEMTYLKIEMCSLFPLKTGAIGDVPNHGLATEEGRRTSFPPLRYGCQLQTENQNKHG